MCFQIRTLVTPLTTCPLFYMQTFFTQIVFVESYHLQSILAICSLRFRVKTVAFELIFSRNYRDQKFRFKIQKALDYLKKEKKKLIEFSLRFPRKFSFSFILRPIHDDTLCKLNSFVKSQPFELRYFTREGIKF